MKMVSIAEAKNRLPALVHEVEDGEAVELTRHGHPVAVMFSIGEYQRFNLQASNFSKSLNRFREQYADSLFDDGEWDELNQRDAEPGREVEF